MCGAFEEKRQRVENDFEKRAGRYTCRICKVSDIDSRTYKIKKMNAERLAEYRAMVGLQLQFAQEGDNDQVMKMQEGLEHWIAERLQQDVIASLQEMKARPLQDIVCNMTVDEVKAYRVIQGNGMRFFCPDGFEGRRGLVEWKRYQVDTAEMFVGGLLEERLLDAVRPFLTIRVN
jgi:hypothetical protein